MIALATSSFVFVLAGVIQWIYPPQKINYWYGYGTKNAMKNHHNWSMAQKLSSQASMILGLIGLCASAVLLFTNIPPANEIASGIVVIKIVSLFLYVEYNLKQIQKIQTK